MDQGGDGAHDRRAEIRPLTWLLGFVRPQALSIIGVLALSLAATGIGLAQPYITKFLIDDGLIARDVGAIALFCGLLLAAALGSTALGGLNRWVYTRTSGAILFRIRETVYRHLQTLSPKWFARTPRGDLMARIDGDIAEVQRFAVDPLLALTTGVIALAGSLALMLSLSAQLTLLAFALFPLQALYLRKIRPAVERRTRTVRERTGDVTGFFLDRFSAMRLIQSVGAEEREADRLSRLNQTFLGDLLELQVTSFFAAAGPGLMTAVMTAVVFLVGGMKVVDGVLTIGTLIAFTAYMARATGPVNTLLGLYVAAQRAKVSLNRVRELVETEPEVSQPLNPLPLPAHAAGAIDLTDVTFSYQTEGQAVLDCAQLHIEGGTKMAITGPSGGGKSTLIDLLMRHFDPDTGQIRMDGVDLKDLDIGQLRSQIGIVEQDATIIAGTITENIAYARPGASTEEIEGAARAVRIDSHISSLPKGYDTVLETGGEILSGGQRQRIAIARALLRDPLVLILDEATSSVDTSTAREIIETVDDLFGDRTRIIVSHHSQPLEGADRIVELRDGQFLPLDRKEAVAE